MVACAALALASAGCHGVFWNRGARDPASDFAEETSTADESTSLSTLARTSSGIDPEIQNRLSQLEGKLSVDARAELVNDLKALDPELWSFLLGYYEARVDEKSAAPTSRPSTQPVPAPDADEGSATERIAAMSSERPSAADRRLDDAASRKTRDSKWPEESSGRPDLVSSLASLQREEQSPQAEGDALLRKIRSRQTHAADGLLGDDDSLPSGSEDGVDWYEILRDQLETQVVAKGEEAALVGQHLHHAVTQNSRAGPPGAAAPLPAASDSNTAVAETTDFGGPQGQADDATNHGAGAEDWRANLSTSIARLEQELEHQEPDNRRVLEARLRLLYLAAGRDQDSLRPIRGIPSEEQGFWSSELFGLAAMLDESRIKDASLRAAFANRELRRATQRLGEMGLLDVRNLAFCRAVESFGIYTPFHEGPDEFLPGQDVLLYAEIENFSSRETADGFETSLNARYEIRDDRRRKVAGGEFSTLTETCKNYRRDFFVHYRIRIPNELKPGRYQLHLIIEDTHAAKSGETYRPFDVIQRVATSR